MAKGNKNYSNGQQEASVNDTQEEVKQDAVDQVNDSTNQAVEPAVEQTSVEQPVSTEQSAPQVEEKSEAVVEQQPPKVYVKGGKWVGDILPALDPEPVETLTAEEEAEVVASKYSFVGMNSGDEIVIETLLNYVRDMGPTVPMDATDGTLHQMSLYRALIRVFNDETITFTDLFSKVIEVFKDNSPGVFDEYHMFRFFDELRLPKTELLAFRNLLSFINVASKAGRNKNVLLKQVRLDSATQFGVSDLGRRRIYAYFNIE